MSALAPALCWLSLGVPSGLAFWYHGRRDLAVAVLPFAGAVALLPPLMLAAWVAGDLAHWPWQSVPSSVLLGALSHLLLRAAPAAPPGPAAPAGMAALPKAVSLALLAGACAYPLVIAAELARGWPGYGWDGQVIWLVRTRVLSESSVFPQALFSEPQLAPGHWDYPLLFPALLAWFARLGGLELRELALALGVFAAAFPLATAMGLMRMLGPALAAVVALAPFCVPELVRYHFQAYADPLLTLTGVAGLAWTTLGALRADRACLLAGGMALAAAVSIKNEGILWLLAGGASVVLLSGLRLSSVLSATGRERAMGVLCATAPGLLLFVAWRLTCRWLETPEDLASQLRHDQVGTRFLPLLTAFWNHLVTWANLPLLLGGLAALVASLPGSPGNRLRWASLLLAGPGLLVTGLFAVYLGTPHDLGWHVLTSLHRTLYGVVPAVVVVAACASALRAQLPKRPA